MKKGVYTALVTPFLDNGYVDYEALERILDMQLDAGVAGVVVLGTTGECPTLMPNEREQIVQVVLEKCKNKCEVWVGCGSNSTARTIEEIEFWNKFDVNAILLNLPSYNKPNKNGLARHVELAASTSQHPVVLYNIPGRSALNLSTPFLKKLCQNKSIAGIKEASGNLDTFFEMTRVKPNFFVFGGNDPQFLQILRLGGDGIVSVASNLFPSAMNQIFELEAAGKTSEAEAVFENALPFLNSLFLETNPVPIKYYMEKYGICSSAVRLPLGELEETTKMAIEKTQLPEK